VSKYFTRFEWFSTNYRTPFVIVVSLEHAHIFSENYRPDYLSSKFRTEMTTDYFSYDARGRIFCVSSVSLVILHSKKKKGKKGQEEEPTGVKQLFYCFQVYQISVPRFSGRSCRKVLFVRRSWYTKTVTTVTTGRRDRKRETRLS